MIKYENLTRGVWSTAQSTSLNSSFLETSSAVSINFTKVEKTELPLLKLKWKSM